MRPSLASGPRYGPLPRLRIRIKGHEIPASRLVYRNGTQGSGVGGDRGLAGGMTAYYDCSSDMSEPHYDFGVLSI